MAPLAAAVHWFATLTGIHLQMGGVEHRGTNFLLKEIPIAPQPGIEPQTSRSGGQHSTAEPERSKNN